MAVSQPLIHNDQGVVRDLREDSNVYLVLLQAFGEKRKVGLVRLHVLYRGCLRCVFALLVYLFQFVYQFVPDFVDELVGVIPILPPKLAHAFRVRLACALSPFARCLL